MFLNELDAVHDIHIKCYLRTLLWLHLINNSYESHIFPTSCDIWGFRPNKIKILNADFKGLKAFSTWIISATNLLYYIIWFAPDWTKLSEYFSVMEVMKMHFIQLLCFDKHIFLGCCFFYVVSLLDIIEHGPSLILFF